MSSDPFDGIPERIGARIKELRTAKGLSGRKLAAAAEVSQPFLSQLESGRTSVGLATLFRIARALDVTGAELLSDPVEEEIEVYRRRDFTPVVVGERPTSANGQAVFRAGRTISELFDYVIEPGQDIAEWFESTGEHAVYCIDGSVRIEFENDAEVVLDAGDVLFYRGHNRHRWHLGSDVPARVILVAT